MSAIIDRQTVRETPYLTGSMLSRPHLRSFFLGKKRYLERVEAWGSLYYDFEKDEFHAVRNGATEKLIPSAPIGCGWLVVAACNLKCVHCYGNVEELPPDKLDTAHQLRIADEIIAAGVMRQILSGGEPLLRPGTLDVIEKLADNDVAVILGTNGTYVNTSILRILSQTSRVELSLDSGDEELNNKIRPSRNTMGNSFQETLRAMEILLNGGVRTRVLTCLNSYNYRSLETLADLLYSRGIRDWGISWTLSAGRARFIYDSLVPKDQEVVEAQIDYIRLKYPDMVIKSSNRTDKDSFNRYFCLIMPDGHLSTDDFQEGRKIQFHSLLETPLLSAWNSWNFDLDAHFKKWVNGRISDSDMSKPFISWP